MKRKEFNIFALKMVALLFFFLLQVANSSGQTNSNGGQSLKQCWVYSSDKISYASNASDNDLIFISSLPSSIQAINSTSGNIIWSTSIGGNNIANLLAAKNQLVVLSETGANYIEASPNTVPDKPIKSLISINSLSGIPNWKKDLNSSAKTHLYLYEDFLVLVEESGVLRFINLHDGSIYKELDIKEKISAIDYFENILVLGTFEKKIKYISLKEFSLVKEMPVEEIPEIIFISESEKIIWSDKKGGARLVDTATKKLIWKKRFGGAVSSISKTPSGILISSLDNFVYHIDKSNGKVIWRKRLAGRIAAKPLAKENFVVVFAYGDATGLVLSLKDGKVIDIISLSDANQVVDNPVIMNDLIIFPTLKGLFAYSFNGCSENKKTSS